MNKKIYQLSLALATILWLSAATAQQINRLPLKPAGKQAAALSFSGMDIITTPGMDTACLGFHVDPAANISTPLAPDTTLHTWLQTYANKNYTGKWQPSGDRLIVVLKQLRLQIGENHHVKFTASAYRKIKDSVIQCAYIDTLISDNARTYQDELDAAFEQLAVSAARKTTGSKLPMVELTEAARSPSIMSRSVYNTGAYMSFDEFLQNKPSVTQVLTGLDEQSGNVKVYELMADSIQREISKCWGLCINNELYAYDGEQLIPLEQYNDSFVMSLYVPIIERKNQAMVWRHIVKRKNEEMTEKEMGVHSSTPYEVYPDIKLEGNVRATRLDLSTGKFGI